MSRPIVIVAEAIADEGIDALAVNADVVDLVGADRAVVLAALAEASAIIVRSATKVDRAMIEAPALFSDDGIAVTLLNWSGATCEDVTVRVVADRAVRRPPDVRRRPAQRRRAGRRRLRRPVRGRYVRGSLL